MRHVQASGTRGCFGRLGVPLLAGALALAAPGPAQAADENPYFQPDDSWISISGTVQEVMADTFVLDYGDGRITVEMDDGDRDADAYKLISGDKVTVHGKIDDDLFETRSIEAGSVYVEKLGTTFYASAADEEDLYHWYVTTVTPVVVSSTVVQGTISEVRAEEFVLNTGLRRITVETDGMPFDPLDDAGYLKLEVGDVVRVQGNMDTDLLEGRELVAESIVKLSL